MEDIDLKIKNSPGYDERSAGGIVFKKENNKVFWLLIKTISRGKRRHRRGIYKFPKGHLKKDEFLKQAALREVEEEGKVKAKIITKLGSNNYIIWDDETRKKIIKKVTFFLMEYLEKSRLKYFDSEVILDQEWCEFKEAEKKIEYKSERILLNKARYRLEKFYKK